MLPGEGNPQQCPTAHLAKITQSAFSTDGEQAAIQFENDDGEPFILTMPVDRLHALSTICRDMLNRQERRDLSISEVAVKYPDRFSVGHNDMRRGVVYLTFDEQLVTEAVYCMPNPVGLDLARELQSNIEARMSTAERHDYARRNHPLMKAIPGKIILPGG